MQVRFGTIIHALAVSALLLFGATPAVAGKTQNIVLIVSDGLRWQEIFTGADRTLLNEKEGGSWLAEADLRKRYWRDDVDARRAVLFPFLWGTVAKQGQIYGNQLKGSVAHVTNGKAYSYPGYNEMLTGSPDPKIDSNEFGPNPNLSVFEWLNGQTDLRGQVGVYATWDNFKDIFNVRRSNLPLHVGWDLPYKGALTPRQELMNQLYRTTTRVDFEDVFDSFMEVPLLDSLHARWMALLEPLTEVQWKRTFLHPDLGVRNLDQSLSLYAWHGRHHVAHVTRLRERMGW